MDRPAGADAPPPADTLAVRLDERTEIPVRRHGNPDGPRLLVSHGSGLAVDLYAPFWSRLLDDFDVVVFDLRNHGRNPRGDIARHSIPKFCQDLDAVGQAVDRAFGVRPRAGVFHSVSCLAAALSPALGASWEALVLFDPPFVRPGPAQRGHELAFRQAAARTRIRAERFRSEAQFLDVMSQQPALARVPPDGIRRMARTTLRRTAGGGLELACPRDYEAKILAAIPDFSRFVDPGSFPVPTRIIAADPALKHYFLPPCRVGAGGTTEFEFVPGTTHLAQFEEPEACVRRTVEFLSRQDFVRRG